MTSRPYYQDGWRVDIDVRDGVSVPVPRSELARAVARALDAAGASRPASIGLILSDDAELAELNEAHMGVTGPTDVLSFPLLPPEAFPPQAERAASEGGSAAAAPAAPAAAAAPAAPAAPAVPPFPMPPGTRVHLGDIVVSVERAVDQARSGRGGHTGDVRASAIDELRLLVTHGALHVCGWDHAEPDDEASMRALERRLLGAGA